jgi:pilus assembly protein CpaC
MKRTLKAAVLALLGSVAVIGTSPQLTLAPLAHAEDAIATHHNSLLRIGYDEPLPASRNVMIGLNKTMIVELPRGLRDVVVSNPEILDAVVQSSNRVFLIAKKTGSGANVFFFDENGEQMLTLDVAVEWDSGPVERLIDRVVPGANVKIEMLNDTAILTGTVPNPADASRVADIVSRALLRPGEGNSRAPLKVVNMLVAESKEQVLLKVLVAEVNREVIKRLGVNWNGVHVGDQAIGFATNNTFPASGGSGANSTFYGVTGADKGCTIPGAGGVDTIVPPVASALTGITSLNCLARNVEAFERTGLLKSLAEPTLTAISGETASFLAGGEFPIPVADKDGTISVSFKPFGVGLSFTPLVLSEGRINLKIQSEVSEISTEGAVVTGSIAISGLKVRRTATTVELPSGGSLAIAGLIRDDVRQNIDGVPGLKSLPILGSLFRSRDFLKQETELMVVITPYMVDHTSRSKLALPTDGLMPASDARANFLGQLNKIYGRRETLPAGEYEGNYGFIVE